MWTALKGEFNSFFQVKLQKKIPAWDGSVIGNRGISLA